LQAGLSTYSFPWSIGVDEYKSSTPLTAYNLLQFAAAHDIHYVQFCDNMPLHLLSRQELKNLKEAADNLHINIQVGTRKLTVENISLYLSIAQKFNAGFLRVVIDDADFHPDEQQVIEIIQTLLPQLKQTGIRLAIENHDRFSATTLQNIIQQTSPTCVGICLDTANSLGANEGINEVMQVLGLYTVNLHIKDIIIKRLSHKMGFMIEGCAAGEGILNIPQIIQQLEPYNKCKTVTLEVWSQPEATIEQSIAKEKQWVEASIKYLKTILA
jgi:sugar phosphate isomerase/epimerase